MKKKFKYLLAFLIPLFIMLLIYIFNSIYPFGNKTLLTVDLQDQYVEFFTAFRNILHGDIGLFYSFSKTLGGNMFGLFAYYLSSPINLIVYFFNSSNMMDAVLLINLIKIGFCGLTSFIYFDKTFKKDTKISIVFSIIYSLMAYNIVYSQNLMWLDGVIWLPIIFLGIDRLIEKKPLLYYISLTITIMSNYYIGYMICIGSLLYFLYKLYIKNNYKISLKENRKDILYFLKYSLLCAGTSAIILLPSIFSLLAGKTSNALSQLVPRQTYPALDLISKFYLGTFNDSVFDTLPNIYISVMMILLVFLYFFNKKINIKERKISLIFISIFIASFLLYPIDLIWHLFQHPIGFVYRYSFIFDFVILIIAYNSFIKLDKIDKSLITKFILISFLITLLVDKFVYNSSSCYRILGTFIFLLIYSFYLYYRKNKNLNKFIIVLMVIEMFISGLLITNKLKYEKRNTYLDFINSYGSIINKIKEEEDSFYRIEKDYNYSTNDSMLLNYNGISHFSSTYEGVNNKLLGDYLGIFNRFYVTNYHGSTLATNSLFNIKYLLSEKDMNYYTKIGNNEDINIYENTYNLPFIYMVDDTINDLELIKYQPFENQNNIFKSMTNNTGNVFEQNQIDSIVLNNIELNEKVTKYIQYNKITYYKDASLEFNLTSEKDGLIYVYIPSDTEIKTDVLLNGKSIIDTTDDNDYRYNILELGYFKKGEKIKLEIVLLEDTLKIYDYMFYTLNEEQFNNKIELLNQNDSLKITESKSDYIKGTINVTKDNQILYTSIPIDKGWHIYIDDKEVKCDVLLNTFIGVTIDNGEHTIEFEYIPQGFGSGLCISLVSITLFGYCFILDKKKIKE